MPNSCFLRFRHAPCLWAEGGPLRWLALLLNTAAVVLTGDIPSAILVLLTKNLHLNTAELSGKILTIVLVRPAPLILLAMAIFYLWAYLRRAHSLAPSTDSGVCERLGFARANG